MGSYIAKYSAFAVNALKQKYTYRFKVLMWSFSTLFNMLVQYYLWRTIYSEVNGNFMGIAQNDYLTYISFGVVFYNVTSCMENMNIAEDIKTGNIAINLTKPLNYKTMVFFRHIGSKAGEAISLIPLILIAFILTSYTSMSLQGVLFFGISTVLAMILFFLFSYLMGILTFWTTNYWGLQFFTNAIMGLFSGQLVAINFYIELGKGENLAARSLSLLHYPGTVMCFNILGKIAYYLPFQSMYYTPMAILSGIVHGTDAITLHIFLQFFWILCLNAVIHIVWNQAQKKIIIYGG
ncbi:MAG: ABC transporter permease [Peptoanaerobacter stomatis]|uniref:ABC transporter permease n=1 Tax=Peptoanaerobacter stomatis TaxID=796937 RepID=UPI003FA03947